MARLFGNMAHSSVAVHIVFLEYLSLRWHSKYFKRQCRSATKPATRRRVVDFPTDEVSSTRRALRGAPRIRSVCCSFVCVCESGISQVATREEIESAIPLFDLLREQQAAYFRAVSSEIDGRGVRISLCCRALLAGFGRCRVVQLSLIPVRRGTI